MKRIIVLVTLFLSFSISPFVFAETQEWIEKGFGATEDEAVFDAKWKVITKAMEKAIGDQSQDRKTIDLIKKIFKEDPSRYLRDFKLLATKKDGSQYGAKVHGTVEMATIRTDSKEVIKETGHRELPTVTIKVDDKSIEGALAEKFKSYGYNCIDYTTFHSKELTREFMKVNYVVEIPVADYKYEGKNKTTGEDRGSFHFRISIVNASNAQSLGDVQDTVTYSAFERVKEYLYTKAVDVMFNRVNSQIISTWKDAKSVYIAYISGVDRKKYDTIVDILVEMTGDENPKEDSDVADGHKVVFKKTAEIQRSKRKTARDKIVQLGILDEKYEFVIENNETSIKLK